jgi:hypothetical protein
VSGPLRRYFRGNTLSGMHDVRLRPELVSSEGWPNAPRGLPTARIGPRFPERSGRWVNAKRGRSRDHRGLSRLGDLREGPVDRGARVDGRRCSERRWPAACGDHRGAGRHHSRLTARSVLPPRSPREHGDRASLGSHRRDAGRREPGGDVVVCRSIANRTLEEISRFEAWAREVTWRPNGRKLAVQDDGASRVLVWDLDRDRVILHASGTRPAFDPSGELLATDYGVRNVETGASLQRWTPDHYPHAIAWWPRGAVLCTAARVGLVVWGPREGWRSERFALSETPELLCWDAAGRYLVSVGAKGRGSMWSTARSGRSTRGGASTPRPVRPG